MTSSYNPAPNHFSKCFKFSAMVAYSIIAVLGWTVLVLGALAVQQPELEEHEWPLYRSSLAHIRSTFEEPRPAPDSRVQYYPHLLAGQATAERDAWNFAHEQGMGPVHVSYDYNRRYAYVTTKIPRESTLGRKWGLGQPQISDLGFRRTKDAYAYWKVSKRGAQLLRLDLWSSRLSCRSDDVLAKRLPWTQSSSFWLSFVLRLVSHLLGCSHRKVLLSFASLAPRSPSKIVAP
ncbi:hypothetical protein L1887_46833 [Cichorium endivia]|nr:hypothetical protein L1887_46833 [Cichorium endivia]